MPKVQSGNSNGIFAGSKNIIFDLDGTIIDSKSGVVNCLTYAFRKVCPTKKIDEKKIAIGPPLFEILSTLYPGVGETKLRRMEKEFRDCYDKQGGCEISSLYPGMRELLPRLAEKKKLLIVTNKPAVPTERILQSLNIGKTITGVVSIDTRGVEKPNKASMIKYALAKYCLEKKSTVLVGDSEYDILSAKECGLGAVAVTYGYGNIVRLLSSQPDAVASDVASLGLIFEYDSDTRKVRQK